MAEGEEEDTKNEKRKRARRRRRTRRRRKRRKKKEGGDKAGAFTQKRGALPIAYRPKKEYATACVVYGHLPPCVVHKSTNSHSKSHLE